MARWNEERVGSLGDRGHPPADSIHSQWRPENDDPPNLERFTWQEAIQDSGVAELYERSRGTGVRTTTTSDE